MSVEVVNWNPRKRRMKGILGRLLPKLPPVNNFGDLLGPRIVDEILAERAVDPAGNGIDRRLLAVGSILHFARPGDVVWGSGVNGKSLHLRHDVADVDVRAVRGPLTAEFLRKRGVHVPPIYGDPGLLVARFWPRESFVGSMAPVPLTVIPNLNDVMRYQSHPGFWHPCSPLLETIARIATSDFVVGSSLHAMVLADSFGVPSRLISSEHEPSFKYEDYYRGSGREGFSAARSIEDAVRMGGETPLAWSEDELLAAFPWDLWTVNAV
ncbi:polysaccharide pyruvyl transferase family protein [Prescottella equi]|uniref:Polysaccharide pyruvyl transferase family protein n=3 Tax=Rhodococcus hoagii TaxID=43767 RepID=A0AAP2F7W5_RHOHA|nr:polysaccharide pyruvyl transferase family protein [Prescottella equi]MBM4526150.1 polysaccharide pyruvyl transferase family protein [Prescottella equi]MBM4629811.1 polysaccharide pyruvyl transferase family protein [Prescottella equi]MBM4684330.1 polysaccharide pyruvyl transferase family protein [Prescottella equi]MBM4730592.1 polysaccharide pyruvyl transferase family protein [Prescottella equi]QPQ78041.1 polysaccharide pyruvyl transferase family protein [Prescottella equi]